MSDCQSKTGEGRDQKGRFKPGNPGRPKGTRHRVTVAAEKLLAKDGRQITAKAIEMALAGDSTALKLCIDRICPVRKDAPVSFELPRMESATEAATAAGRILEATAAGQLTPLEAASVMGLVEQFRRCLEASEFEERLTRIEEALK